MIKKTSGRQTRDGAEVRRVQVTLDDATIERAKALGKGNVSQGIRKAVASLPNDAEKDERGMMAAQTTEEEMNIEIREVEGITAPEIEAAVSGPIWAKVGRRWNTGGGGFSETVWSIHTAEPASAGKFATLVADSPSEGPVENALTRAVRYNANRGRYDAFRTDPRVQRVWDAVQAVEPPPKGVVVVRLQ